MVDQPADADPLLDAEEAAELLGYSRRDSWRSRASRLQIKPDDYVDARSPRWRRSTVLGSKERGKGQGYRSDLKRTSKAKGAG